MLSCLIRIIALSVYDFTLSFSREFQYIRGKGYNRGTVLYLSIKYITILHAILELLSCFIVSEDIIVSFSDVNTMETDASIESRRGCIQWTWECGLKQEASCKIGTIVTILLRICAQFSYGSRHSYVLYCYVVQIETTLQCLIVSEFIVSVKINEYLR